MKFFALIIVLMLLLIIGLFIVVIAKVVGAGMTSSREKRANDGAPMIDRPAWCTAKRTEVRGGGNGPAGNQYFATFEFPDRGRAEFRLSAQEFAMLAERDQGILRTQGTAFRGFQRGGTIQDRPV